MTLKCCCEGIYSIWFLLLASCSSIEAFRKSKGRAKPLSPWLRNYFKFVLSQIGSLKITNGKYNFLKIPVLLQPAQGKMLRVLMDVSSCSFILFHLSEESFGLPFSFFFLHLKDHLLTECQLYAKLVLKNNLILWYYKATHGWGEPEKMQKTEEKQILLSRSNHWIPAFKMHSPYH